MQGKRLSRAWYGLPLLGVSAFGISWLIVNGYAPTGASRLVLLWWSALCAIAVVNVGAWLLALRAFLRSRRAQAHATHAYRGLQCGLSAAYVFVCAFRSVLPRADLQRICFVDSWISSVFVGRSLATVAELCFALQWALLLHRVSHGSGGRFARGVSWVIVPLIAIAEIFSWYGVITTWGLANAIEESLWAFSAILLFIAAASLWKRCNSTYRPLLATAMILGAGYITFQCTVDVPMYVGYWLANTGAPLLSFADGLRHSLMHRVVTFRLEDWLQEMTWMFFYFSVGVWTSIALTYFPRPAHETTSHGGK